MAISASSTDIERIFSRGRDLLEYRRNCLSPESLQALLCLGDWIQTGAVTVHNITGYLVAEEQDESDSDSEFEDW